MKYKIIFVISMVSFLSCNKFNNKIPFVTLKSSIEVNELSDSTYFKNIRNIVYGDYIYASDEENGRILKLDTNLNLLGTIGNSGQGPKEFAGIGYIAFWKDTLLALNVGGSTLSSFTTDGQFIDRYSIGTDYSLMRYNFCIDDEGFLYFTSTLDSFPIVKYDRKMNRLFGFGEWNVPKNKELRNALNNNLIAYFDNKIITVQADAPIINMYSKDGKHLLKKELPDQLFKKRLTYKNTEQAKNAANLKKVYGLFGSIATLDNKIYLLYIDQDNQSHAYKNKIVELLFENNDFIINKVYSLSNYSGDWFDAFVFAKDNKLIASKAGVRIDPSLNVYQLK